MFMWLVLALRERSLVRVSGLRHWELEFKSDSESVEDTAGVSKEELGLSRGMVMELGSGLVVGRLQQICLVNCLMASGSRLDCCMLIVFKEDLCMLFMGFDWFIMSRLWIV